MDKIDVNDLEELLGKINLIDIRESFEYESGHIPTAKNMPMKDMLKDPDNFLDKDKEYYIICQTGRRSSITCSELRLKGFKVKVVTGGTDMYEGELEK
ncbi:MULTISPECIES: rhodanese-like domain-containing protein [Clostridium]|uniref:Thiosulfate sulfurtransferase GlpE n=2 Tax=Clostridium TaxID=1485 RepID=A0A151AL48_9CLOT|nr:MULTISPECIES: rhodanese-like domain-containing protein [Clostridium]KYH28107.1 thiosulfate sulfurtransferase GlpE [Clostridium colicanis DSM 13634]MBE6043054.1 rhodanese-like domain-containing protein [Clostridium thermopalmarium]PRR70520.1 molybdopterin biosynthesis protein MoeB [Clostridium thermopalmarium DSM 5974]PVZ21291.1 rhodanese-related sulfurtransferase [Clostridium thermopalmarium DSM 5974]